MENEDALMSQVDDNEDVARMLFSRNSGRRKSHAGIFTTIDNVRIKGGVPQTVERMLAQMYLVNIAQKRVCELE